MLRNALILCLFAGVFAESVHWQWRELICKTKDEKNNKEASDCEVLLKESENDQNGRKVPLNTCFDEDSNGQPRHYCNILCPGAATAYRITRYPQNHRDCFTHLTYRLEKRGENFLMWREGKCRTTDIQFTIRCEFSSARADFMSDGELFANARNVLS
uniref:Secreted protein n=1 Tax=Haemonchus contortus TaxID=6289 RepID=A0A7I4YQJ4_HAECO